MSTLSQGITRVELDVNDEESIARGVAEILKQAGRIGEYHRVPLRLPLAGNDALCVFAARVGCWNWTLMTLTCLGRYPHQQCWSGLCSATGRSVPAENARDI